MDWKSLLAGALGCVMLVSHGETPRALRVGIAGHAFDHLGTIGDQAETAIASGATILYATGLGADGYSGLPAEDVLRAHKAAVRAYNARSKAAGASHMLGYLCATSLVGLESFDRHWSGDFRAAFQTPPSAWRQQGTNGQPLRSWYGGAYEPACMNHPDWREYERRLVRMQLEAGHDGIFFDNPTVHPQGCYCPHCMQGFHRFLRQQGRTTVDPSVDALRRAAAVSPEDFARYRATIARDFLVEMRRFARTVNPKAWITCNNSLNSPTVLYSQSKTYGYNIHELSKAEDFVVVEDMGAQPRVASDGRLFEYGPTYRQLHALNHGKPIVAVTIAEADYHTPANLMRLAMAEAVAHEASYLSWPTWPENQRQPMIEGVRPAAAFYREHDAWLNGTQPRRDVILALPFQDWTHTPQCRVSSIAATLTRSNIQYQVLAEEEWNSKNIRQSGGRKPVIVVEDRNTLGRFEAAVRARLERRNIIAILADAPDWEVRLASDLQNRSLRIDGPTSLRGIVRDTDRTTLLHLYNLNIERLDSFQDRVHSADNVQVECYVPRRRVRTIVSMTPDAGTTSGLIPFECTDAPGGCRVRMVLPRVEITALLRIE